MPSFAITNAVIIQPDRIIDRGTVQVKDGLICCIEENVISADGREVIDAQGAYLAPGAIDTHNDNLEFEVNPRPGANLPLPFAVGTMERRLIAAGVTTEFHAIAFMERPEAHRTVDTARQRSEYIATLADEPRAVDHLVIHRVDVWHPDALDSIFASLEKQRVRYLSLNDHTPGQGQYRDVEKLLELSRQQRAMRGKGFSDEEELLNRMKTRSGDNETIPYVYSRIKEAAEQTPMIISTHDDDSPEKVDAQWELGATIAEFPVTFEAAQRARDRGMFIVVGAPNIIRGGSQSGNLAATELLGQGFADIICADYYAPSLFPAAFRLVADGLIDLPGAIKMITATPARALGLNDRGSITEGMVADLVLMQMNEEGYPQVESVYRGGDLVYSFGTRTQKPAMLAGA